MASPRRSSAGSRSSGRAARPSRPANNSQPLLVVGGIALAVVIVILVLNSKSDGGDGSKNEPTNSSTPATPVKVAAELPTGPGKAGKTPGRPAPEITAQFLGELRELETKMQGHYNDGVKARTAGDNSTARDHQAKAKDVWDVIDAKLEKYLLWQEEAEEGGWAQPPEYAAMIKFYMSVSTLAKKVRMGGGK